MDLERVKRFINLMEQRGLSELEVKDKGFGVLLRKVDESTSVGVGDELQVKEEEAEDVKRDLFEVRSPLVGTFFFLDEDSRPFVEKGTQVKAGDLLCVIEAMGVMNEVRSEVGGVVSEIFLEDGLPVEYGQPLFLITVDRNL